MWTYLIDTNVISESTKENPDPNAMQWMSDVDPLICCLSVLTIAEIHRGISILEKKGATTKIRRVATWLERIEEDYTDRILGISSSVARVWGYLPASHTLIDSLIAATAIAYNLTVVTRNTSDFLSTGAPTFNPFLIPSTR